MSSHLLEIINKNIEFQKNYIEFELLDTKFAGFAKYISPVVISLKNEVKGAELSSAALIELYNELIGYHTRLKSYEDEIAAYVLQKFSKTITFERLEYLESFKEQIQAEDVANNEVLQYLVLRVIDIRKRQIIIRKVLGDMALMQLKKDFSIIPENWSTVVGDSKFLVVEDIHPSLKIVLFAAYTSGTTESKNAGPGGSDWYMKLEGLKIIAVKLDDTFTLYEKIGEISIPKSLTFSLGYSISPPSLNNDSKVIGAEFSSLGDVIIIGNKIYDFSEYGLALSPNWQGVTLDIIESRG